MGSGEGGGHGARQLQRCRRGHTHSESGVQTVGLSKREYRVGGVDFEVQECVRAIGRG